MADAPSTFSESWYRVAGERLCLRPSVRVQRQHYRGERWIVIANPFNNQFYRVRPSAYEFIARLRPEVTVEQAWRECLEKHPDEAPGQEAVIQLLSQLYQANLLHYTVGNDAAQLFKQYEREQQRQLRGRLLNVMFMRFPLWDPDRFLLATLPVLGRLISPIGALLWLLLVGWGVKMGIDHWEGLKDQFEGVLDPSNLLLLYLAMASVKAMHELGHAYFCRKFGGEVHAMGIMLMIFTPIPYVDATSSWGVRERWKRVMVGLAGVLVELAVAATAMLVWSKTGQGTLHSLAYNVIFIASVTTLLFNLNPLLRFDGYYVLSDLVGIPNLNQRASRQLRYLGERWLFGLKKEESPAHTRKEAFWLVVFGIASGIYRVILFGGILLLLADRLLILGIIMAIVCAIAWVATPTFLFLRYLFSSPKLDRCRPRAIGVTFGILAATVLVLQFVPFPSYFRAPGLLRCEQFVEMRNTTEGHVAKVLVPPGSTVRAGDALVQMANPELDEAIAGAQAKVDEVEARLRQALQDAIPNLKPLQSLEESARKNLRKLESDRAVLTIRAPQDGIFVAPDLPHFVGRWLARGSELGLIIDERRFQFHAVVRQEDGDRLFAGMRPTGEVKLHGCTAATLQAGGFQVIPAEKRNLPSPSLGWQGGGPIPTAQDDPQGIKAAEPFFEVRATIQNPTSPIMLHGRGGIIRFRLPNEPLLPRWIRDFRQLLQKRYQL